MKRKLIFDIGSSRVNGALVVFNRKKEASIERVFQSESIILPETDLHRLWKKMALLIDEMVKDFKDSALAVDEALVVFSSPWYFSEIREIKKDFGEPVAITGDFIEKLLTEDAENFKKHYTDNFNLGAGDLMHASSRIMSAKLNDYPILEPLKNMPDKKTQTISAFVYASAVFGEATAYIKRALEDCGVKSIEFQSSPFVFLKVFLRESLSDLLIVDIGGEITDVIVIKGGKILKMVSFGRGLNYAARRLGPSFKVGLDEVMALLSNYIERKLEKSFQESVAQALKDALTEWQSLLKEALEKHIFPDLVPQKVFVTGHGGGVAEFKKALNLPDSAKFTEHGRPFEIFESKPAMSHFKNASYILNKPHLSLIGLYSTYAIQ